jgi:hypothetical protein
MEEWYYCFEGDIKLGPVDEKQIKNLLKEHPGLRIWRSGMADWELARSRFKNRSSGGSARTFTRIIFFGVVGFSLFYLVRLNFSKLRDQDQVTLPKKFNNYQTSFSMVIQTPVNQEIMSFADYDPKLGFLFFSNLPDHTQFKFDISGKVFNETLINHHIFIPVKDLAEDIVVNVVSSELINFTDQVRGTSRLDGKLVFRTAFHFRKKFNELQSSASQP